MRLLVAVSLGAAMALSACAVNDPAPAAGPGDPARGEWRPLALPNAGFELPPEADRNCARRWNCSMHANPSSYVFTVEALDAPEGRQAMCVERVKPEPWSIATQYISAVPLRGARVRVSIAVRIEEATARGVAAGPWLRVNGLRGELIELRKEPVKATNGWQRVSIEAPIAAEAYTLHVGATQLGGGRACFDEFRLEVLH
jgi:hypothetical protein